MRSTSRPTGPSGPRTRSTGDSDPVNIDSRNIVTNNNYSGRYIVTKSSDPDIVTINISDPVTNHSDPALRCSAPMHKDMVTHCEAQDLETCAS